MKIQHFGDSICFFVYLVAFSIFATHAYNVRLVFYVLLFTQLNFALVKLVWCDFVVFTAATTAVVNSSMNMNNDEYKKKKTRCRRHHHHHRKVSSKLKLLPNSERLEKAQLFLLLLFNNCLHKIKIILNISSKHESEFFFRIRAAKNCI